MIQTRNYVTVDFQGKEIPSGHLRPFNLTANDGDIHQYATDCIIAHWHQEMEIFISTRLKIRNIWSGKEKAALSIRTFCTPSLLSMPHHALIIPSFSTPVLLVVPPEAFLIPPVSVLCWKAGFPTFSLSPAKKMLLFMIIFLWLLKPAEMRIPAMNSMSGLLFPKSCCF